MQNSLFDDRPASPASAPAWFTAHCDGGSRGNPGPAGYGAIVHDPKGQVAARLSEYLGIQTNNFAEYSGLLAVLKWALENAVGNLKVVSDSELMVKQIKGQYSVKSPALQPLYQEAKRLSRQLAGFKIEHTLRAGNKEADELANQAMDRGMGKKQGAEIREQGSEQREKRPTGTAADSGLRAPAARPYGKLETTPRPGAHQSPKAERQVLEGYVKNGVVHLLGGELPDGIFVKIVRES